VQTECSEGAATQQYQGLVMLARCKCCSCAGTPETGAAGATVQASGREINQTEHSLPLGNSVKHTPCIYYWLRPAEEDGEEDLLLLGSSRSRCGKLEMGVWMPSGDVRGGRPCWSVPQSASTPMVCGLVAECRGDLAHAKA
jgi:hypothetical protein